jgi:enamine deaminase RidA (YjgF/YER057c/UK114 family)
MARRNVPAGTIWEDRFGYSRAVKVGNLIHVSGTADTDPAGVTSGRGDAYAQTRRILQKIEAALKDLGASMGDVVRTRIYTTDIDAWEEIARAHGEFFSEIKPATSLLGISRLIDPDMVVEIEAEAIVE